MSHKIFLVELNTAIHIRDWVAETSSNGTWSRTLDSDINALTVVEQNGTALTATTSTAGLATAGTWYFNPSGRKLWARTNDASNPSTCTNTMIATILEPLMHGGGGGGLIKARGTADLFWDNRVIALPSVDLRITPNELGAGSVATFGELIVNNADGRYDAFVARRIFTGQPLTILRGQHDDDYSAFETWMKGTQEQPQADAGQLRITLTSLGRRLDRPIQTNVYSTADFADLDANVIGFNRPKMWGTVRGAEAFRVATCTWELASHAMTSIDLTTIKTALGDLVCTSCRDLANGRFTAATSYADTEDRLYGDGTGYDIHTPGALLVSICKDFGLSTSADLNGPALATLDTDRAVKVGFQVREGAVSEALDVVARSAFIDWYVDRTNVLGGRIRRRDAGNKITNGDFETDTAGWSGEAGGAVARTTSVRFRGVASLEVTKPTSCSLARGANSAFGVVSGRSYIATMVATIRSEHAANRLFSYAGASPKMSSVAVTFGPESVTDGSLADFRIGVSDGTNEYLSSTIALSACEWRRATQAIRATVRAAFFFSYTGLDVTMANTAVLFSAGAPSLRVYPQYGGADGVAIAIDDVELVEALVLDDGNARYQGAMPQGPILYRVRAGYAFDGRTQTRRFSQQSNTITQRLSKTAESRAIPGHLVCTTDAATVAQAVLDYFSAGRIRAVSDVLSPEDEAQIDIQSVVYQDTSRRPSLPGHGQLFRIVALSEQYVDGQVPRMHVEAEAQVDPIFKIEAVSIV